MTSDPDCVVRRSFERILRQERSMIFDEIIDERNRQLTEWGRDMHTPEEWMLIIGKHIGRLNETILQLYENGNRLGTGYSEAQLIAQRKQIIKCAALLVAWEEQIRTGHLRIKDNETKTDTNNQVP